ncbi:MAG: FadR family transcriptional regulator [Brevundimonas sp.]|nr:MAG: FadR family transcriptional regulator [Brevundimonas sp.]
MTVHPFPQTPRGDDSASLVQQVLQHVRDHIRENELKVGDSLPGEGVFAEKLGVSRAVMREAFGALAALNVIDVGNGRRARIAAIDGSVMANSLGHAVSTDQISVADVWDVRRTVEARTAALAAAYRTEAEAARIVQLAEALENDIDDRDTMTAHDIAFHEAIASASHNPLFLQIVRSFAPLMRIAVPAAWSTRLAQADRHTIIERHHAIARAIRDGDPAAAEAAMNAHFDVSIGDVLKGLSPTDSIPAGAGNGL